MARRNSALETHVPKGMRRWCALVFTLAMACSQQQTSQVHPGASARSSPPPSQASTQPTTPTAAGLACRIPVMVSVPMSQAHGGWISLPSGSFQADPASDMIRLYQGDTGISYDRAVNRWIPVAWNYLSPDGQRFVWSASDLHVVDVNTSSDKVIRMPQVNGFAWTVIDFNSGGIYVTPIGGEAAPEPGLWVVNPDSGVVRKLDGTQSWTQVDSKAAWGVVVGDSDMRLSRMDLLSGARTTQLTVPYHRSLQPGDMSVELIALDPNGRPLVLLRDWQRPYPWHLALLYGPETLRQVVLPDGWAAGWPIVGDDPSQSGRGVHGYLLSQGIWMIGNNSFPGVALLGSDGVIRQLSTEPPNVAAIAGGCH